MADYNTGMVSAVLLKMLSRPGLEHMRCFLSNLWNETTSKESAKMGKKKREGHLQAAACMRC
jgi:hypothetical protein